jgi:hypothetical protein
VPLHVAHAICLAALEEKNYAFAERVVKDTVAKDAWSYRLLEYCCRMTGRPGDAAAAAAAAAAVVAAAARAAAVVAAAAVAAAAAGNKQGRPSKKDAAAAAAAAGRNGDNGSGGSGVGWGVGGGGGGCVPAGALPTTKEAGAGGASSVGLVFNLAMELAGEPGDWKAACEVADKHAQQYPADALLLMLYGGIQWRRGKPSKALKPLQTAGLHKLKSVDI